MGERQALMAVFGLAVGLLGTAGACGRDAEPAAPEAVPGTAELTPTPTPTQAQAAVAEPSELAPVRAEADKIEGAAPKAAAPKKASGEPSPVAAAEPKAGEPKPGEPAAAVAKPAPAIAGPCGDEDQPPCPLQGWMEKHLQQPFDEDQFARLVPELERVAKMAPDPSWNSGATGWASLAQAGAAAARSGDRDGVQQACKGCHKAWRSKYKAAFRTRAIE